MTVDESFQFLVTFGNFLDSLITTVPFGSELESSAEVLYGCTIFHLFTESFKLLEKTWRTGLPSFNIVIISADMVLEAGHLPSRS
jgi:hypothetical protein